MQMKWRSMAGALLLPVLLVAALLLLAQPHVTEAQSGWSNFTNVRVGSHLATAPKATRIITNGGSLNPLGTLQPISSTAAVGMSGANITVEPAGTLLVLLNVGAQTITFTETGTLVSAGNIALGAGDSASLISNGTNWYQIAGSNN